MDCERGRHSSVAGRTIQKAHSGMLQRVSRPSGRASREGSFTHRQSSSRSRGKVPIRPTRAQKPGVSKRRGTSTTARAGDTGGRAQPAAAARPASMGGKVCQECGRGGDGRFLEFNGKPYHVGHLRCCGPCRSPFKPHATVKQVDGRPYCFPCHAKLFMKTCFACSATITGRYVQTEGKSFHEHCFVCSACSCPINPGAPFCNIDGRVFCERDYQAYAQHHQCPSCGLVMENLRPAAAPRAGICRCNASERGSPSAAPRREASFPTTVAGSRPGGRPGRLPASRAGSRSTLRSAAAAVVATSSSPAARPKTAGTAHGPGRRIRPLSRPGSTRSARSVRATQASPETSAPSPTNSCAKCQGALSGRVVCFNRQWFHAEHLTCSRCDEPSPAFVSENGEPYCQPCHVDKFAKRCAVCTAPIQGRILTVRGRHYHPQHFKCTTCKSPMSQKCHFIEDYQFCPPCFQEVATTNKCFNCNRVFPKAKDVMSYSDGRVACRECDASAVWEVEEANVCFSDARAFLVSQGLTAIGRPWFASIKLELAKPAGLARARGGGLCGSVQPLAITVINTSVTTTSGPGAAAEAAAAAKGHRRKVIKRAGDAAVGTSVTRVQGDVATTHKKFIERIVALGGMPRVRLASVLAHEACHAYMALQQVELRGESLIEGTCELWAYEYLRHRATKLGCKQSRRWMQIMRENQASAYGEGLRAALESYEAFSSGNCGDAAGQKLARAAARVNTGGSGSSSGAGRGAGAGSGSSGGSGATVQRAHFLPAFMRYVQRYKRFPPVAKRARG